MTKPRLLQPEDAAAWRELRLHGLKHEPRAFGATLAEEQNLPLAWFAFQGLFMLAAHYRMVTFVDTLPFP